MRLKKEKEKDYIEIHKKENIWKSVVNGLKKAGFDRMLIFKNDNNIILFEEADNLKKAYEYLNNDEVSQKWDRMISEWMEVYPAFDHLKKDIEFIEIPVVFYYKNGKLSH